MKSLNDKKLTLVRDIVTIHSDNKKRIYHDMEGSFDGYYFFAKTDNSHKEGYRHDGINKGSVYKLDLWEGGHPVDRDSVKGKGINVASDFVAGYWNKWDVRPKTAKQKLILKELLKQLEVIAEKKTSSV